MKRRIFLGASVAGLSGCGRRHSTMASSALLIATPTLIPVLAQVDRIFRITVRLRPFRAAGPRLDVEKVGEKTVVHSYGHGGSGWSLSWRSSSVAVEKAMTAGQRDVAVIGAAHWVSLPDAIQVRDLDGLKGTILNLNGKTR